MGLASQKDKRIIAVETITKKKGGVMKQVKISPEATVAAWRAQAGRLQKSNSFADFIDCLFSVWNLMEEEVSHFKGLEDEYKKNFKLLFSQAHWNKITAFREYLQIYFSQLQRHAANPTRVSIKPASQLPLSKDEYAVVKIMQELLPNNVQATVLDRLARLMLGLYWSEAACVSPVQVPGFLLTAVKFPQLFFYRAPEIQCSVKKFLKMQKKGLKALKNEVNDVMGWKVEFVAPIFDKILEKLSNVYLSISSITSTTAKKKISKAKRELEWLLNFIGTPEGTFECLKGTFKKTDCFTALMQAIQGYCIEENVLPLHYGLLSHLVLFPEKEGAGIISLPPFSSFWNPTPSHPYLDLIDSNIPHHFLCEDIDFKDTLFYKDIYQLYNNIDGFDITSPAYKVLTISGLLLSNMNSLSSKSNNAVGTALCTFISTLTAIQIGDDKKVYQVLVATLGAGTAQVLPKMILHVSNSLNKAIKTLEKQGHKLDFDVSNIHKLLKIRTEAS